MCLPIQFLKSFLKFGTGLTIIASIITFSFGIYLLYKSNQLDQQALYVDYVKVYKDIIQYSLIVFGVILFIIGVFGMIGAGRKKTCCLFLFQIGAMFFTLVFIGGGITTQQLSIQVAKDSCQDIQWSQNISQLADAAEQIFATVNCKAYINISKFDDQTVLVGYIFDPNNSTLPTQVQQCDVYDTSFDVPAAFLAAAEKIFSCSGWCDKSNIYMFTDVNLGNPSSDNSCFVEFKNFIEKNGLNLSYIFYAVGALLGLLVITAFCLCFHPQGTKRQANYYQRMGYYED